MNTKKKNWLSANSMGEKNNKSPSAFKNLQSRLVCPHVTGRVWFLIKVRTYMFSQGEFFSGSSSRTSMSCKLIQTYGTKQTCHSFGGGGEVEDVMEPYTTAAIRLCQQTESIKYPEIINGSVVSTSMAGSRRLLPRSMFLSDVLQRGHERKRSTCAARTHLVIDDDSAEKIARRQRGDGFAQTEAKNNVLASDGLFEISHAHHLWSLGTYRRRYSMNRS